MQISQSVVVTSLHLYICPNPAMRLHILEQDDYYLMETLNSLLMILPQGKIFNMLRRRLDSTGIIPKENKVHIVSRPTITNPVDVDELFEDYKEVYGLK